MFFECWTNNITYFIYLYGFIIYKSKTKELINYQLVVFFLIGSIL